MSGTIVLVPGFMGADIYVGPGAPWPLPGVIAWGSWLTLAAGSYEWLGLDPTGMHGTSPIVGDLVPGPAQQAYYGTLRNYFTGLGWTVATPQMDWRQDPALDAARLVALLDNLAAAGGPVNVIAHSRGGLVTRLALGQLGTRAPEVVARVAGLGVPHYGTLTAVAFMAGFSDFYQTTLNAIGRGIGALSLETIRLNLSAIIATWPAVYSLFTSPLDPVIPPVQIGVLYSAELWQPVNPGVVETWLSAARVGWAALPPVPASVPWLNFAGTQFLTPISIAQGNIPTQSTDLVYIGEGDGVVSQVSASYPGSNTVTSPTQHSALPRDPRLLPILAEWVNGQAVPTMTVAGDPLS